jgi:hypothetical protein
MKNVIAGFPTFGQDAQAPAKNTRRRTQTRRRTRTHRR